MVVMVALSESQAVDAGVTDLTLGQANTSSLLKALMEKVDDLKFRVEARA
jgi:hypothetical protein